MKTPWFCGYSVKAYYFRVYFRSWSPSCLILRLGLCLHHWQRQTAETHCSASDISISFVHFIAQFIRLPFSTGGRRRTRVCRESICQHAESHAFLLLLALRRTSVGRRNKTLTSLFCRCIIGQLGREYAKASPIKAKINKKEH